MFSSDFGVIPFIPDTWGGVGAKPGATGVNVTIRNASNIGSSTGSGTSGTSIDRRASGAMVEELRVLAFSGPRSGKGSDRSLPICESRSNRGTVIVVGKKCAECGFESDSVLSTSECWSKSGSAIVVNRQYAACGNESGSLLSTCQ